jgi:hypothetical protein
MREEGEEETGDGAVWRKPNTGLGAVCPADVIYSVLSSNKVGSCCSIRYQIDTKVLGQAVR